MKGGDCLSWLEGLRFSLNNDSEVRVDVFLDLIAATDVYFILVSAGEVEELLSSTLQEKIETFE